MKTGQMLPSQCSAFLCFLLNVNYSRQQIWWLYFIYPYIQCEYKTFPTPVHAHFTPINVNIECTSIDPFL